MAWPNFTSGNVMDTAAALMNDPSKTIYTYIKQLPYFNIALKDLQRVYELNEIPVTAVTSAVIPINAGATQITFGGTPALPADLVEPKLLWERQRNVDPYIPMSKVDFLPQQLAGVQIPQFIWYVWQGQKIQVLAANQDNDIKMEYTCYLFTTAADTGGADSYSVINAQGYLEYRTAAHLANYIAENPTRAAALTADAERALEESAGISTKGRQAIATRHRPFRAGYKRGQNY